MPEVEFERLVEEFYVPLYHFGLSLSRKPSDAADLTQHTFYTWASKGYQLRDASKVKTWLFTTLYREFLAMRREAAHFVDAEEDSPFVPQSQISPSIADTLDIATVQRELQALKVPYRAAVTLFYLKQHSYREIAEILGIPIGTVMSRIHRGRAELRGRLIESSSTETPKVMPPRTGERHG